METNATPAERVALDFTGVTWRGGVSLPYIAWVQGSIRRFCRTEAEALIAVLDAQKLMRK